jgi:hypothetical protein
MYYKKTSLDQVALGDEFLQSPGRGGADQCVLVARRSSVRVAVLEVPPADDQLGRGLPEEPPAISFRADVDPPGSGSLTY